jgi:hypothetical protein
MDTFEEHVLNIRAQRDRLDGDVEATIASGDPDALIAMLTRIKSDYDTMCDSFIDALRRVYELRPGPDA